MHVQNRAIVRARITFLSPAKGGRSTLPELSPAEGKPGYRPHLVVEGTSEYLGVRFVDGSIPDVDIPGEFSLELAYPEVDYSPVKTGARFTIREGNRIVATGEVL